MKTAKYVEIRQAVPRNGSKMVVKIGVLYYRRKQGVVTINWQLSSISICLMCWRRSSVIRTVRQNCYLGIEKFHFPAVWTFKNRYIKCT